MRILPSQLKQKIDSGEKIVIIDLRDLNEYRRGHIRGSILIPVDNLKRDIITAVTDKNIPICVYCYSGMRSAKAESILLWMGYKNVYNLGGISNWPYDIEM